MKTWFQAILSSSQITRLFFTALAASLLTACQTAPTPKPAGTPIQTSGQHQGLFERGPRAAIVGEHGTYNIAWITVQDQVLMPKPVYEVLVSFHPTNRGPGGVKDRHWAEMMQVAEAEIARRCQPSATPQILSSNRDYDARQRAMGAELRVNYSCS